MYWGDAWTHKIERSNLDGNERTVLLVETPARYYAMTLDSTFLYFTDWNSSKVRKLDRYTRQTSAEPQAILGRAYGIYLYKSQDTLYTTTMPTRPTSSIGQTTDVPSAKQLLSTSTYRPTVATDQISASPSPNISGTTDETCSTFRRR
jgi:hypothetical protein